MGIRSKTKKPLSFNKNFPDQYQLLTKRPHEDRLLFALFGPAQHRMNVFKKRLVLKERCLAISIKPRAAWQAVPGGWYQDQDPFQAQFAIVAKSSRYNSSGLLERISSGNPAITR